MKDRIFIVTPSKNDFEIYRYQKYGNLLDEKKQFIWVSYVDQIRGLTLGENDYFDAAPGYVKFLDKIKEMFEIEIHILQLRRAYTIGKMI